MCGTIQLNPKVVGSYTYKFGLIGGKSLIGLLLSLNYLFSPFNFTIVNKKKRPAVIVNASYTTWAHAPLLNFYHWPEIVHILGLLL